MKNYYNIKKKKLIQKEINKSEYLFNSNEKYH